MSTVNLSSLAQKWRKQAQEIYESNKPPSPQTVEYCEALINCADDLETELDRAEPDARLREVIRAMLADAGELYALDYWPQSFKDARAALASSVGCVFMHVDADMAGLEVSPSRTPSSWTSVRRSAILAPTEHVFTWLMFSERLDVSRHTKHCH